MEGFIANGINGQQQLAGHFMQGYHTGTTGNRGWVKLVYMGSPVSDAPYAFKSKIVPIGGWDMMAINAFEGNLYCKTITWSSLGMNANRVGFFQAIIFSNPFASPFGMDGIADLHKKSVGSSMPTFNNGVPDADGGNSGGIAIIDQQRDLVRLEKVQSNNGNGYFENGQTGTSNNRGMFRVDYLGGSCEQGGSGFLIKAVPSNAVNNCATASGNLVIEGAGSDIWNNSDEFTFVYKSYADNAGHTQNRSFSAKLESQGNSNGWAKTGVMVRVGTGASSAEVSMLATPSNGVQWTIRTSDGGTTTHPAVTANTVKAPIWVRIVKTGTSYVGSYSSNGTTWTQLGSAVTIATGATYYAGLAATSMSSSMNNSTFSNLGF